MEATHRRFANGLSRWAGLRLFRFFSRPSQANAAVAPDGLDLQYLAEREALALCADSELDLTAQKVSAAFARGDLCVGALQGGLVVGYCWLAFAPLPHLDGVWVRFNSRVVWTYKSLVRASHRGRGIAGALYRYADTVSGERGCASSVICVETHNGPSIRAARRACYADCGYAAYLKRRRRLFVWLSAGARRAGVRFYIPEEGKA